VTGFRGHAGRAFDFGFVIAENDARRLSDRCIWGDCFGGIVAVLGIKYEILDARYDMMVDCLRVTSQSRL